MICFDILQKLAEYIKTVDISEIDVPIGIEISSRGNIYVTHSFSIQKFDTFEGAFSYIENFLKERNNDSSN